MRMAGVLRDELSLTSSVIIPSESFGLYFEVPNREVDLNSISNIFNTVRHRKTQEQTTANASGEF